MEVETALRLVLEEFKRSGDRFGPYHSAHEGHSVIREEMDELWDEVKLGAKSTSLLNEAVQVASSALHFITDLFEEQKSKQPFPSIAIDFDGVIHSYTSKWTKPEDIHDGPVPGAIEFIRELLQQNVGVMIFSTRNRHSEGVAAMVKWLVNNGLTLVEVVNIQFPIFKPKCKVYIDDRAHRFGGTFPKVQDLLSLKTWNEEIRHAPPTPLPEQPNQGEKKSC